MCSSLNPTAGSASTKKSSRRCRREPASSPTSAILLAEHLTGITLTPELLEGSTYLCGIILEPR
ncbi:DUF6461 domain-containing protein [Nonomuraea dietziae]